jgi:hypothetical protein
MQFYDSLRQNELHTNSLLFVHEISRWLAEACRDILGIKEKIWQHSTELQLCFV